MPCHLTRLYVWEVQKSRPIWKIVRRIWEDAAGILETASSAANTSQSDLGILIDERNGLRIVNASGWGIDALRREYRATTAYTVTRTGGAVVVEGQSGSDHCILKQRNYGTNPLSTLLGSISHHVSAKACGLLA
jgi:hypothetical protein